MDGIPDIGLAAVLQARGEFDPEKMRKESWPGGCQVTVHGGVEEGESLEVALLREIVEELGKEAVPLLMGSGALKQLGDVSTEDERAVTFGVLLNPEDSKIFLKRLRLGSASGGLRFLRRSALGDVVELKREYKEDGVRDRTVIAMFPDELEAVRLAFEQLT